MTSSEISTAAAGGTPPPASAPNGPSQGAASGGSFIVQHPTLPASELGSTLNGVCNGQINCQVKPIGDDVYKLDMQKKLGSVPGTVLPSVGAVQRATGGHVFENKAFNPLRF
jgi:hypothetical protein